MEIIDIYFKDIRKTQPFTYEQEQDLARQIQKGDRAALNTLVKGNLRFVVTVARRYQGRGLELVDLIQEGNLGLIRAAEKFDPDAGFRFITYAVWWIQQCIYQALSNNKMVRLPMNMVGVANQINKASGLFLNLELREPTDLELATLTGLQLEDIRAVLPLIGKTASLSAQVGDDENGGELSDLLTDDTAAPTDNLAESESCMTDVLRVLSTVLTEREANIVIREFGIGCKALTDEQVAELLGVSAERIRQIKHAALKKLKKSQKVLDTLRPYLG